jgi:hypothetical protein
MATVHLIVNSGFFHICKNIYENLPLTVAQIRKPGALYRNSAGLLFYCCFSTTTIPGCTVESKRAFAVSSERSGMVFNTQKCSTQREEPRLREAGQVMQETEYSVHPERLADSMPFQGLLKAPGFAGGPDCRAGWCYIKKHTEGRALYEREDLSFH